jgi:hypothetical protein
VPLCTLRSLKLVNGFWCGFFIRWSDLRGRFIVYNTHNIVEKHFSISIAPVRSRSESLLLFNAKKIIMVIIKSTLKSDKMIANRFFDIQDRLKVGTWWVMSFAAFITNFDKYFESHKNLRFLCQRFRTYNKVSMNLVVIFINHLIKIFISRFRSRS